MSPKPWQCKVDDQGKVGEEAILDGEIDVHGDMDPVSS